MVLCWVLHVSISPVNVPNICFVSICIEASRKLKAYLGKLGTGVHGFLEMIVEGFLAQLFLRWPAFSMEDRISAQSLLVTFI